jgi:hypothetical protein
MPKHESSTEVFLVQTTIIWPGEQPSDRVVNWNNPKAVRSFARISNTCLAKGGETKCKRITEEEADAYGGVVNEA